MDMTVELTSLQYEHCFLAKQVAEVKKTEYSVRSVGIGTSRKRRSLGTQVDLQGDFGSFASGSGTDELAQALRNDTLNTVDKLFPNLYDHLGKIVLDSRVQVMPTTYYKLVSQSTPGVVVIGDSFQSDSPATGSGLSKVLTDVKTLSKSYIPQWKNQRKISVDDIASYYKNQQKTVIDRRSLKSWFYSDYGSLERMPILGRIKRFLQLYFRHGARG